MYSPEKFGIFALVNATVLILGSVTCLSYEMSILKAKKAGEAANLVVLSLLVNTAFSGVITIAAVICILSGVNFFPSAPGHVLLLIPLCVFFFGATAALQNWFIREKEFKFVALAKLINTIVMVAVQLLFGFLRQPDFIFLIYGLLSGLFISAVFLLWILVAKHGKAFLTSVSFSSLRERAGRNRNFPLFIAPAAAMNSFSWQSPIYIISFFFDAGITGLYSQGMRLIQMPMNLIGQSISQVVYQRSALLKKERLAAFVVRIYKTLLNLILLPSIFLCFFGGELFSFFLGPEWQVSGIFSQILAPWAFVWFLSTPLGGVLYVLEKQPFIFILNILVLVTRVGSILIGGIAGDPFISIILFAATGVLVYGFSNFMVMKYAGISYREIAAMTVKTFLINAPFIVFFLIIKLFFCNTVTLVISLVVSATGYVILNLKDLKLIAVNRNEWNDQRRAP